MQDDQGGENHVGGDGFTEGGAGTEAGVSWLKIKTN